MRCLYNDIDEKACAWTQELINAGEIPAGKVLCKSITEITPDDIKGFTQVHYFNGISGWAYALKLAGWNPARPVWCASLPCQPFSVAGARKGTDDERHLWPCFLELVKACKPEIIFGEQVASADVLGSSGKKADEKPGVAWLDGICADLEEASYTVGAVDLPSASIGSPNIRQRLFWVAHRMADATSSVRYIGGRTVETGDEQGEWGKKTIRRDVRSETEGRCAAVSVAHTIELGLEGHAGNGCGRHEPGRLDQDAAGSTSTCGDTRGVADSIRSGLQGRERDGQAGAQGESGRHAGECSSDSRMGNAIGGRIGGRDERGLGAGGEQVGEQENGPGAANKSGDRREESPWARSILIPCRDGKARRIPESGIFPLVDGFPGKLVPGGYPGEAEANATGEDRTTRLRGYGNAINPYLAAEFIIAAMESL